MTGARGATVPFYIVVPTVATAKDKVPGVVLLHGKGGRAEDMLIAAQYLSTIGYASLIPEIVGHGARRDPQKPVQMFGGDPMVLRESILESVQDIRRTLDVFVTQPEVDAQRIGLMGYSLGAILGSITTAVEPRLRTAVLIVGGGNWKILLGQSQERDAQKMRDSGILNNTDISPLAVIDPVNFAAHISPRPVLFINGNRDTIIPKASAQALIDAAKEPKKQMWLDYDHNIPPQIVAVSMREWLDENLKKSTAPLPASSPATQNSTGSASQTTVVETPAAMAS
jgi:dienelactone hydrolase